uniref:Uncharacterized protein n=1 Tax=Hucho hucho TaxID=62062 RepID=A0A4W5PJA6_9TELE
HYSFSFFLNFKIHNSTLILCGIVFQGWATLMGVGFIKHLNSSVARGSAYPHPYPHMQSEPALAFLGALSEILFATPSS